MLTFPFDVKAWNELLSQAPVRVKQGHLSSLQVTIPWRDLLSGDFHLEIEDLELSLELLEEEDLTSSMTSGKLL